MAGFAEQLTSLLTEISDSSTGPNKFNDLRKAIADRYDLAAETVSCKFLPSSKNLGNRLAEALHNAPRLLVVLEPAVGLVFDSLRSRLADQDNPNTLLVLSYTASGWSATSILGQAASALVGLIRQDFPETPVAFVEPRERDTIKVGEPRANAVDIDALLSAVDLASTAPTKFDEFCVGLSDYLGTAPEAISCKALSQRRNYYNRIGEAWISGPAFVVLLCAEGADPAIEVLKRFLERSGSAPRPTLFVTLEEGVWVPSAYLSPPNEPFRARVVPVLVTQIIDLAEPTTAESGAHGGTTHAAQVAEAPADTNWRAWDYVEWNRRLIEHCFGCRPLEGSPEPVTRISATPEELTFVADVQSDEADDITRSFANLASENAPRGVRFCGYCLDHQGHRSSSANSWTSTSQDIPHFFGMLWLTLLVQYGYPTADGGFHQRMWNLLGTRDQLTDLPSVWRHMRDWTAHMRQAGRPIRELILPPDDGFRTRIGASYYLAFPHWNDRKLIAEVLISADLVGFEPPIAPVLSALQASRCRFSSSFRKDLEDFIQRYVNDVGDPRDSPFWRAVRQEALDPSFHREAALRGRTALFAVFDDEGFLPFVAASSEWQAPSDYDIHPLDDPVDDFDGYVVTAEGELEAVTLLVFTTQELVGFGVSALLRQGILIFREVSSELLALVSGQDIAGADMALVREELAADFCSAFGGEASSSRIPGWQEVAGCHVTQLDELPAGLDSAVQLLRTMSPPAIRFVSGVPSGGGFLAFPGFLPRVRAADAENVWVTLGESRVDCTRTVEGDWLLPPEAGDSRETVPVGALWRFQHPTGPEVERESEKLLHLQQFALADKYKPLSSGAYYLEACRPGQREVIGGVPIPLLVTAPSMSESMDLLPLDPSMRYLGAGHGEISLEANVSTDWLVVGPKNHPDLLVFIGDPKEPQSPARRRSPSAADRRHWKKALSAKCVVVRTEGNPYDPLSSHDLVREALSSLKHYRVPADAPQCAPANLESVVWFESLKSMPSPRAQLMADAVAALACRRSGLRYKTIQNLFSEFTECNDYLLHSQLIQAWSESGVWDLLRRQDQSQTLVVPRRPRFVATRRGPEVEGTLVGLVTSARASELERSIQANRITANALHATSPWQLTGLRVRCPLCTLEAVSSQSGLEPIEWIRWKDPASVPSHLDTDVLEQDLRSDSPPAGFELDAVWDWDRRVFNRHWSSISTESDTQIERRTHKRRCSIYVVKEGASIWAWTYIQNWALLLAYALRGQPPFVLASGVRLESTGRSPVHLPLPWGRICAALGAGLPGPKISSDERSVTGYIYPLGARLAPLVKQSLPVEWLG